MELVFVLAPLYVAWSRIWASVRVDAFKNALDCSGVNGRISRAVTRGASTSVATLRVTNIRVSAFDIAGSVAMDSPEADVLVGREADAKNGTPAVKHVTVRMGL